MADVDIDALVTGLVREFLFRRGLTGVLRTFDDETGYERGGALASTRDLVESLRLSTLYKRNASSGAAAAARARARTRCAVYTLTQFLPPASQTRRSRACSKCSRLFSTERAAAQMTPTRQT